jgi:hypothetical protein
MTPTGLICEQNSTFRAEFNDFRNKTAEIHQNRTLLLTKSLFSSIDAGSTKVETPYAKYADLWILLHKSAILPTREVILWRTMIL